MQVFAAKDLGWFELEVAKYLAKLPSTGYALIGFNFFNQEQFEINGIAVFDTGIICCLEIREETGTWLGNIDQVWSAGAASIKCKSANNPWQQVNYYVLYAKNLLWSKLNKGVFVNGLIITPNETEVRVANVSVDNFSRINPLTICHIAKLEAVFEQIQNTFQLTYEMGRAERWMYALIGQTEADLRENSTPLSDGIIRVKQDIQRLILHSTDLTEQVLSELIKLNVNVQRLSSENRDLTQRMTAELDQFTQELRSQNQTSTDSILTDLSSFKLALQEQNSILANQFLNQLDGFKNDVQSQNKYLIIQLVDELVNFKQEVRTQNLEIQEALLAELKSVKLDLRVVMERSHFLTQQLESARLLLTQFTQPNWWQKRSQALQRWLKSISTKLKG